MWCLNSPAERRPAYDRTLGDESGATVMREPGCPYLLPQDACSPAPVAQRIEQQPSNLSVVGSSPTGGAKYGSDKVRRFRDSRTDGVAPHIAPHMWDRLRL
jgi:hypothetical protein